MIDSELTNSFILNQNSPKISNNPKILVSLKDHQSASVQRMIDMENNRNYNISKLKNRNNLYLWESDYEGTSRRYEATNMKLNCGVLCNPVGSGKSLIILSVIANKKLCNNFEYESNVGNDYGPYLSFSRNMKIDRITINSNLIIVPHPIYNQWIKYIKLQTKLDVFYIKGKNEIKHLEELINKEVCINESIAGDKFLGYLALSNVLSKFDIVLVKSTAFRDFVSHIHSHATLLSEERPLITWSRFIIDEINSIDLPSNKYIRSNYTWFITSSVEDLFCCQIKNNGFLRSVWKTMTKNIDLGYPTSIGITSKIITLNKDAYEKLVSEDLKKKYFGDTNYNYYGNTSSYNYNSIPAYFIEKYYNSNEDIIDEIQNSLIPSQFIANMLVRCSNKFIKDSWKLMM